MEILSDTTFKGEVRVNGKLFANDGLRLEGGSGTETEFFVEGGAWFNASCVYIRGSIDLNRTSIYSWSDLNNILCFAPSSLSCTVSSLCTTVSSHTTKINSLCTTVAGIQPNTKHVFGSPTLPAGCTKFYFVDNVEDLNGTNGRNIYKFVLNKWYAPVSSVQVFKGGDSGVNEEVQMDVKQYTTRCMTYGSKRYFEGTLASNTTGYDESEFFLVFDNYGTYCESETLPQ